MPNGGPVPRVLDSRRAVMALFAVGSSAVLFWFGTGLESAWPLAWFAPLPVLLFALRGSWWGTTCVAFGSRLIGGLDQWHYFRVLQSPPFVWVIIYAMIALLFTASVLCFRALLRRGAFWSCSSFRLPGCLSNTRSASCPSMEREETSPTRSSTSCRCCNWPRSRVHGGSALSCSSSLPLSPWPGIFGARNQRRRDASSG